MADYFNEDQFSKESSHSNDQYTIGWICALPVEKEAAGFSLDLVHGKPQNVHGSDHNVYRLGEIGGHYVVVAILPQMGTIAAANAVQHMLLTFPNLRCSFMVGVAGGVPGGDADIRLGDVVISCAVGRYPAVVQIDKGKEGKDGFEHCGALRPPPPIANAAVQAVRSGDRFSMLLDTVKKDLKLFPASKHERFLHQGEENDILFHEEYDHPDRPDRAGMTSCNKVCDTAKVVQRPARESLNPVVHFGTIGSGNAVIKNGRKREKYRKNCNILCVEMEAAGIMDSLPCLVVRGICDYSDSHKNKRWQPYAALMAAASTRELLMVMSKSDSRAPTFNLLHSRTSTDMARVPSDDGRQLIGLDGMRRVMTMPISSHLEYSEATQPNRGFRIPFERNEGFLGREDLLTTVESRLFANFGICCSKTALLGMGGVGKTQVALELFYRTRDEYPLCSIFWVQGTSCEAFTQSYREIARCFSLNIDDSKMGTDQIGQVVKEHLETDAAGQWLLILDNADDPDLWLNHKMKYLNKYIPFSKKGAIVVTTCDRQIANILTEREVLVVDGMGPTDARDLIMNRLDERIAAGTNKTDIPMLVKKLSFLPLAIIQAASFMNVSQMSVSDYLRKFAEVEEDSIGLLSESFSEEGDSKDQRNAFLTTWFVSFDYIRGKDPLAARVLLMLASLSIRPRPDGIPGYLLPLPVGKNEQESNHQHNRAIKLLQRLSLIQNLRSTQLEECPCGAAPKAVTVLFSMHRLVARATRSWLQSEKDEFYNILRDLAVSVLMSPHAWRKANNYGFKKTLKEVHIRAVAIKFCSWLDIKEQFFDHTEAARDKSRWLNDVKKAIPEERVEETEELYESLSEALLESGSEQRWTEMAGGVVADFTKVDGKLTEEKNGILRSAMSWVSPCNENMIDVITKVESTYTFSSGALMMGAGLVKGAALGTAAFTLGSAVAGAAPAVLAAGAGYMVIQSYRSKQQKELEKKRKANGEECRDLLGDKGK
ncbi:purine and uridine phosphorylase [Ascobolus immersus RN42]|uniref:Purine and uridine phosphorylase n=1 Tax=Ascobolus immersus RN42 TaxID=1160509 RepID=A0A3N4I025_ASCIM|nr:purine and uridine phosphorylase [Ascobolus immersus RN42]